jgi:ATP-dependent DNA helicase RecG
VQLESGELIFIYHVAIDPERLFCRSDNEEVYLRTADENRGPLSREQVRTLEYDKEIRKYEEEPREDFDDQDLNIHTIMAYKESLDFSGTDEELMVARNLASRKGDKTVYTNAAILLFADDPDKYITNARVRYVRYKGTEALTGTSHNVIKDEDFRGNIPTLIETLKEFIYASLRDYYYLDVSLGRFVKISEYPQEAWLEGVVNALCHRSYNIQGNCIYIKHFDDRLEISNSGPLPAQVTVENIQTERYARNPRVARVLSEMGYVRELNEGVPRIYQSMEKSMLAKPEYSVVNDTVRLLLRNKVSDHEHAISEQVMKRVELGWNAFNETQKNIIIYLFEHHQATLVDLAKELHITETAVRNYLNDFCEFNLLERRSEKKRDKNAIYTFKKSLSVRKKS